jgi:hypothetical protein
MRPACRSVKTNSRSLRAARTSRPARPEWTPGQHRQRRGTVLLRSRVIVVAGELQLAAALFLVRCCRLTAFLLRHRAIQAGNAHGVGAAFGGGADRFGPSRPARPYAVLLFRAPGQEEFQVSLRAAVLDIVQMDLLVKYGARLVAAGGENGGFRAAGKCALGEAVCAGKGLQRRASAGPLLL